MRTRHTLWILLATLVVAGCQQSSSTLPSAPAGSTRGSVPGTAALPEEALPANAVALTPPPAGAIPVTPQNSKIEFVGTKPDGKHDGGFKTFSGGIELSGDEVTAAKISVEIDAGSLYADNPKLTGHLKSPDFFDVKTHPKASFVSTGIKASPAGDATHTVTGDLTLHGETKSISFPAKITLTADTVTLTSEFQISRKEFGMTFGPDKVDDPVTIKVSIKASRK